MRKNSRGFSLIELLIVVAIILIIAAIAIPDLLKSRQAANQASAVGSLRTINTSEVTYASTYTTGFSQDLTQLDGNAPNTATNAGLIDSVLAGGVKSGYSFTYTSYPSGTAPNIRIDAYVCDARPTAGPGNGNFYFTDMSGVIRQNTSTVATSTDSPLAG
jgi:type IV pilus assembly protein PilA